ncbi:MAG: tetratricopeptide repeat protein [SAR324 cluster bacterium]|nr:tetratricopeptide repeat protein [SAR324 cluster bacterium]
MIFQNLRVPQIGAVFSENRALKLLCLVVLTLFLYFPTFYGEFIWDDYFVLVNDPLMTAPDGLQKIWFDPGNSGWNYWPLTRSIFWVQRQLWGLNPLGYHLFNVFMHLLNAAILWIMLAQFRVRGAWLIGLLFAIHPIHAASVAWISEIKNTFSGFFFLISFWCFLLFEQKKKWHWYGYSLIFFLFALLSKTATVMLPVLLIVVGVWFRKRWQKPDVFSLSPFFILAVGSGFISIWFESRYIGARTMGLAQGVLERILVASHVPFFYLEQLLFPRSYLATYPKWNINPAKGVLYLSLISWIIIACLVFRKYQTWGKPVFAGLASFLVTALPVLGIINLAGFSITFVWLHLMYLPSIPILIFIVLGMLRFYDYLHQSLQFKFQGIFLGSVTVFYAALGSLTWHQVQIYQNEETLWEDTLQKTQSSWMAFHNMGIVHRQNSRNQQAIEHFNNALKIDPERASTFYHRGEAYSSLGEYERASEDYKKAIQLNPGKAEYYSGQGSAYRHLLRYEQAIKSFERSIALDPGNPKYYNNRANVYFVLKKYELALSDYQQAIQLNFEYSDAYQNRAKAYIDLHEFEKAIDDLNFVIQIGAADAKTYNTRGAAYFHLKKYPLAIEDWKKSIELDSKLDKVPKNLAQAYYSQGIFLAETRQYQEALKTLNLAIEYEPDLAAAYHARGFLYRMIFNDTEQACRDWQQACLLGKCENLKAARQNGSCL